MKKSVRTFVLILLWSLAGFVPTGADSGSGHGYGQIRSELVDYFQELYEDKEFSGAVLVAWDGKILLAQGFGMADYEAGIPNRRDTVFAIASLTKAFTSMSIMILEERGLLSLDDTVADYFPDFDGGGEITLRDLLGMTSGIFDFANNPDLGPHISDYHTPEEIFIYFVDEPSQFEPGTQFEYCNSGYVMLGLIVEYVSGYSFRDFVWLNILEPLDMDSTSYDEFLVDFPGRAIGYDDLLSDPPNVSPLLHPSVTYAAGGMYSTVLDLYKWDQALYTEQLVPWASLEQLFTPGLGDYGFGWFIDELDVGQESYKNIWHWGALIGYHSFFARLVDERLTVILLSNLAPPTMTPDDLRPVVREVVSIVLED